MIERIVVGTDGSRSATAALDQAVELAGSVGAEVVVVSAYSGGASPFEGSAIELCRRVLDEVKKQYAASGVNVRTQLREGAPADAVVDACEEEQADLVVVGNVGMSKESRLRAGSVPDAVSHHAPCHVLIVHTTDGTQY